MYRSLARCLIAVSLPLLPGCAPKGPPAKAPAARPAPVVAAKAVESPGVELKMLDYDGIQELIASHKGKVIVMDAWSTACPPCIKEFHNLVELHDKYPPDQLACISLSFDYDGIGKPEDKTPRVLKFLREQKATFDNVLSSEESESLYRKFKLTAIPAVFVYNQQGELAKRFDNEDIKGRGEFTYEQVKEFVAELIGQSADTQPASTPSSDAAESS
jgi:thiol-disulfide isomerase/thioredoxin